ncbi:hypothetical protein Pelo_4386 [Pelomyxa schiedti]|nr:hypothetical protein Pelo_4386 [Pelomyxa schiedti]
MVWVSRKPGNALLFMQQLRAKDQFMALAVGVWGNKLDTRWTKEFASGVATMTGPLVTHIGREWIVSTANRYVMRVIDKHNRGAYVLFGVSLTLGVTDGPRVIGGPTVSEQPGLIFLSEKVVMVPRSMSKGLTLLRLNDDPKMPANSSIPMDCGQIFTRFNKKWVVGVDYLGVMTLWMLDNHSLPSGSQRRIEIPRPPNGPWSGYLEFTPTKRPLLADGDDELCIATQHTASKQLWDVRVIDLKKTFDTGTLSVLSFNSIAAFPPTHSTSVPSTSLVVVNVQTGSFTTCDNSTLFYIIDQSHIVAYPTSGRLEILNVSNPQKPVRTISFTESLCSHKFHHGLLFTTITTATTRTVSCSDALSGSFIFSLSESYTVGDVQVLSNN